MAVLFGSWCRLGMRVLGKSSSGMSVLYRLLAQEDVADFPGRPEDEVTMPDDSLRTIEAQVAMLLRLSDRTRRAGARARGEIERSAYLVLGVLAQDGPTSVNAIA